MWSNITQATQWSSDPSCWETQKLFFRLHSAWTSPLILKHVYRVAMVIFLFNRYFLTTNHRRSVLGHLFLLDVVMPPGASFKVWWTKCAFVEERCWSCHDTTPKNNNHQSHNKHGWSWVSFPGCFPTLLPFLQSHICGWRKWLWMDCDALDAP